MAIRNLAGSISSRQLLIAGGEAELQHCTLTLPSVNDLPVLECNGDLLPVEVDVILESLVLKWGRAAEGLRQFADRVTLLRWVLLQCVLLRCVHGVVCPWCG